MLQGRLLVQAEEATVVEVVVAATRTTTMVTTSTSLVTTSIQEVKATEVVVAATPAERPTRIHQARDIAPLTCRMLPQVLPDRLIRR